MKEHKNICDVNGTNNKYIKWINKLKSINKRNQHIYNFTNQYKWIEIIV